VENRDNTKKLFIGNLDYKVDDWEQLKTDMGQIGKVLRATIVMDKATNKSRGFAFLVVPATEEQKFLDADGTEYEGRPLVIKAAIERPRTERGSSGGQGYQNTAPAKDDSRPPRRELHHTERAETNTEIDRSVNG